MISQSHGSMTAQSSVTQYRCCDCERDFKDEKALANHLRVKTHKPKSKNRNTEKTSLKVKCPKCTKSFRSREAAGKHLKSVVHQPLSNIQCLADKKCKKHFNCPSAQLQHLESGACKSGITKKKLNEAIAMNDPRGIITSRGITAQWTLDDSSSTTSTQWSQSPILTPTSSQFFDSYPPSRAKTPTSTVSSIEEFHSALTLRLRTKAIFQKCPLCAPIKTRTYTPDGLRAHLSSSVHKSDRVSVFSSGPASVLTFHCPLGLMDAESKKIIKEFSTVSGLAQHLESGACAGGKGTLKRVVQYVQEEMKNLGFDGRKLLL